MKGNNQLTHQQQQKLIIERLEKQVGNNSFSASVVAPVADFETDPRRCLTSVHFPGDNMKDEIFRQIIDPLRATDPDQYFYGRDSLHITVKNVRVIHDPPRFSADDCWKAEDIFADIIPRHWKFSIYYYRLMLFPYNLALMGTTDPELDGIILELDRRLKEAGLPDDKVYTNDRYFFSNMTLVRFRQPVSAAFRRKAGEISARLRFDPYCIDTVSLVTASAIMHECSLIGTWRLR
jgi:hypothetical protein